MPFKQALGGARELFSLFKSRFFGYERPSDAHSATRRSSEAVFIADMDAPGHELSVAALVDVQDGSTGELWSSNG